MDSGFWMCSSQDCPSRQACFRNAASGTVPSAEQQFVDPYLYLNSISFSPPRPHGACLHFLPALLPDGTVQLPLHVYPTLLAIENFSPWRTYHLYQVLNPPYNLDTELMAVRPTMTLSQYIPHVREVGLEHAKTLAEAGWEVKGYNSHSQRK